jgi:hypothetical protein
MDDLSEALEKEKAQKALKMIQNNRIANTNVDAQETAPKVGIVSQKTIKSAD